jgi:2'-5' RNA ligase
MTLVQLAIIAYPTLEESDRHWMEEIRNAHDPQASRIDAHFTLVFPVEALWSEVSAELSTAAASAKPISFVVRRAEAVRDVMSGAGGHVFLLPEEGGDRIAELHSQLYSGVLRPHRRADIPFVPHITVGASSDFERCRNLAEALNANQRMVRGTLDGVALVSIATIPMQVVNVFRLGS